MTNPDDKGTTPTQEVAADAADRLADVRLTIMEIAGDLSDGTNAVFRAAFATLGEIVANIAQVETELAKLAAGEDPTAADDE